MNKPRTFHTTILLNDEDFDAFVDYTYTPGEPDVYYLHNGDPGHPGSSPEAEIVGIYLSIDRARKNDLSGLLDEQTLDELTDRAVWEGGDEAADELAAAMDYGAPDDIEPHWKEN